MIKQILKITVLFFSFCLVAGIIAYLTLTIIIKSEDTVIIPDLTGRDVVYALELMTGMGLNTKVSGSEYSADVPKNHIIAQEPEPGAEIKKGRDVRIIISKGAKTIRMPNLKGLSIQNVRLILEENDLIRKAISVTYTPIHKKNEIIAQVPSPGTMIKRAMGVDILVSLGPRPVMYKMPDLIGLSIDDAIVLIENNNLQLGEIKAIFDKNKIRNVIISQAPRAGYPVIDSSMVNLFLNRNPRKQNQNYLYGSNGVRLFKYRVENGFLKRDIRIMVNCFGVLNNFFDDFVKPGEEIWVFIPKNVDATVFLYENDVLIKTQVFDSW